MVPSYLPIRIFAKGSLLVSVEVLLDRFPDNPRHVALLRLGVLGKAFFEHGIHSYGWQRCPVACHFERPFSLVVVGTHVVERSRRWSYQEPVARGLPVARARLLPCVEQCSTLLYAAPWVSSTEVTKSARCWSVMRRSLPILMLRSWPVRRR